MARTPFQVLGVPATADDVTIKRAYRQKMLQYHPDHNAAPSAKQRYQAAQDAYECINTAQKRRKYIQNTKNPSAAAAPKRPQETVMVRQKIVFLAPHWWNAAIQKEMLSYCQQHNVHMVSRLQGGIPKTTLTMTFSGKAENVDEAASVAQEKLDARNKLRRQAFQGTPPKQPSRSKSTSRSRPATKPNQTSAARAERIHRLSTWVGNHPRQFLAGIFLSFLLWQIIVWQPVNVLIGILCLMMTIKLQVRTDAQGVMFSWKRWRWTSRWRRNNRSQ